MKIYIHLASSLLIALAFGAAMLSSSCTRPTPPDQAECELTFLDFPDALKKNLRPGELDSIRKKLIPFKFGKKNSWSQFLQRDSMMKLDDNGYLLTLLYLNPDAILINSKQALMDSILSISKTRKCCVKKITILGHGAPGIISVGSGRRPRFCRYINGDSVNRAQFNKIFAPLKGLLCPNAEFILYGCRTGQGEKGQQKLQELADLFGVVAKGTLDNVRPGDTYDQLLEDEKTMVKPGQSKIKTPAPGETDSVNIRDAQRIIRTMTAAPSFVPFFGSEMVGIGVYQANEENLEQLLKSHPAPIRDKEIISSFRAGVNTTICRTASQGFNSVSSSVIIVWRSNGTWSVGHAIYGNRLLCVSDADENTLLYAIEPEGVAYISKLTELTRNVIHQSQR